MNGRVQAAGIATLLLLATLGEGGGSPTGLLAWHGWLVLLLVVGLIWRGSSGTSPAAPGDGAGGQPRIPGSIAVGWGLFLLLVLLGAIRAPYAYGGLLVVIELAAWTAVACLASLAGPDLIRRIVPPLAVGSALQGLLAVYQSLATDFRPAGSFLVPNHLALWLSVVLLLLLSRAADGSRKERLWAWVCGPPTLAGIVSTGSRGAVLGLAAGGAWLLLVSFGRLSRRRRMIVASATAALLLVLGSGLLLRMRDHDPFRYQRVRIWTASWSGFLEEPWWGTGPGQFEARAANQRFPDGDGPLRYDRAHRATHSDWLRVPAEFGAPAALVCLCTAALAAISIARRRRLGDLPRGSDGALAAWIAILTHALVDNPSRWSAVSVLAAVLLGSLLVERDCRATATRATSAGTVSAMLRRSAIAASLLLCFIVADVAPFLAWREVAGLPRGRLDETQLTRLEQALRLNRIHPDYSMRMAEHLAAGEPGVESYSGAREAAERAVRLQPADATYRRGLARIEAWFCIGMIRTEACRERAQGEYRRAEQLSRYDPSIPLELAVFLLHLSDPLGAGRAAERALTLEPEAVLPRMVLAEAWIDGGQLSGARRAGDLLREAEEQAAKWAGALHDPHIRQLLELDREQVEHLRQKISEQALAGMATEELR